MGAKPLCARHRVLPGRQTGLLGSRRPGARWLDRPRFVEECASRRAQHRRVLLGEGSRAPPGALPGGGGWGARIWDSSWRRERAAAYGIAPEELDEYYRKRTTLQVSVVPEDVAEAVLHFASESRSGKSTGNILNVDGGSAAAYPR